MVLPVWHPLVCRTPQVLPGLLQPPAFMGRRKVVAVAHFTTGRPYQLAVVSMALAMRMLHLAPRRFHRMPALSRRQPSRPLTLERQVVPVGKLAQKETKKHAMSANFCDILNVFTDSYLRPRIVQP